ncbi:META domain-containing protein [Pseudochelatococcus sp. G4_1912]|uniref:META domain-containing protein n=1 Tax=Pseudochelatococcus sp. G4_1912 TaxID=3114288 RepID=UPI0039C5FDCC
MLSAISRVASMVAVANTLGFVQYQAHAQEQADTPYGNWLAESIAEGGVVDRVQTTLELHQDGSVSGSSGCNRFRGTFMFTPDTINFTPIAGTMMLCSPAVMDQEQKLYKVLEAAKGWKVEADKLLLLDGQGTVSARFVRQTQGAALTITVPDALKVDRSKLTYDCNGTAVEVEYFNAGNTSLATLSLRGEFVVAANVLSGSGAKYAGKRLIWWTKGDTANLYDVTQDENTPVSCTVAKKN